MSPDPTITSRDGLRLECAVDGAPRRAGLVLCHPHPKMGGTMRAPLLEALVAELTGRGWAVLRFNFRGVGASEGTAGDGTEEIADAGGALDDAASRWPDVPLALAGWSFGAAVALRLAADEPVAACAAIAPAVAPKPGITAGAPQPEGLMLPPTLVVCGANDDQVSPADCADWARRAGALYEEMRGANHFFWGKYDALVATVAGFLDETVEAT